MKCPFCIEKVHREAKVCKHCGRDLPVEDREDRKPNTMLVFSVIFFFAFVGLYVTRSCRVSTPSPEQVTAPTVEQPKAVNPNATYLSQAEKALESGKYKKALKLLVKAGGYDLERQKKIRQAALKGSKVKKAAPNLKYSVVAKQDISYAGTNRVIYKVLAETIELPSAGPREELAQHLWREGNRNLDEFTVFIYLPGMDTNLTAYGIGEFSPIGLKYFRVQKFALYGTKWQSR